MASSAADLDGHLQVLDRGGSQASWSATGLGSGLPPLLVLSGTASSPAGNSVSPCHQPSTRHTRGRHGRVHVSTHPRSSPVTGTGATSSISG